MLFIVRIVFKNIFNFEVVNIYFINLSSQLKRQDKPRTQTRCKQFDFSRMLGSTSLRF